jgi:hypothetical protein
MRTTNRSAHAGIALIVIATLSGSAGAAGTYTIHENLHVGQKARYAVTFDDKAKSTATTNGSPAVTDTDSGSSWIVTLTVQDAKEGSSVQSLVEFDPASIDTAKEAGGPEAKTPCPFVGKSIVLKRLADDSVTNDFQGKASDSDVNSLNGLMSPDEEWYPDNPVSVGDTWDDSAKAGKFASLGPKDQLLSKGRLDWVKTIAGKQVAHLTHSVAIVYHEDANVEEDMEFTMTQLVDIASGVTTEYDEKGSSKYSTPPGQATQVTGGTEFTSHAEALPDAAAAPATRPR